MNIPQEALEAAKAAFYAQEKGTLEAMDDAIQLAFEAAAPYMLKDMRPMTLVEIESRDRPEAMEAARQELIGRRKECRSAMIRAAKAAAWDEAAGSIVDEHGNPIIPESNTNPYRSQA